MEYDFTLKYKLGEDDSDVDELVERLGEAGCTDALVGTGQKGRIALHFTRAAGSARQAILSALTDVKGVLPKAQLLEVTPDFVGLSEVADLLGVTRQNIRKLMVAHADSFPPPLHEGSAAIWHLESLLQWFNRRAGYRVEQRLLDVAHIAMQINITKEVDLLDGPVHRDLRALVA